MVLWVQFLVYSRSSHTKAIKIGSGPCLHGTYDEVGTTKHDWPGVSIMGLGELACGPVTCYLSEAAL